MPSSVIYIFLAYFAVSVKISECSVDDKIVGGKQIGIQRVPYQVSIQYYGKHHCGGSIISDVWILTAAHCVRGRNQTHFTVRAGSTFHRVLGVLRNVTTVIAHDQYNTSITDYDIALVKIKPSLKLGSETIESIELATKEPSEGAKSLVTGWGVYYLYGVLQKRSDKLRAVGIRIVDRKKCKKLLKPDPVTPRMICAGNMRGGKDACQGDSGGPLVLRATLVGIVSWGVGCAEPGHPGVYTNVAYFRDWIRGSAGI